MHPTTPHTPSRGSHPRKEAAKEEETAKEEEAAKKMHPSDEADETSKEPEDHPSREQPREGRREWAAKEEETAREGQKEFLKGTIEPGVAPPQKREPEREGTKAEVNSEEPEEPAQGPAQDKGGMTFNDRTKGMSRWSLTRVKQIKAPDAHEDTGASLRRAESDRDRVSILVRALTGELFRSTRGRDVILDTRGPIIYHCSNKDSLYGQEGENLLGQALTIARDTFKTVSYTHLPLPTSDLV